MINNFVKRILLTSVILLTSSSVIASPLGTFYIKVGGGVNIMSKHQGRAQTYKSNLAGLAEVGVGYNLLDTVRTDLTFTHYFGPEHTASSPPKANRPNKLSGNLKADINTYMVNGYVDLVNVGLVKLFVGGGVGVAQIKQKYYNQITDARNMLIKKNFGTTKKANNLSYSLTGGIATTITPIADVELAYSWNNFGKTKSKNNGLTTHYKGSNIVSRLIFNI